MLPSTLRVRNGATGGESVGGAVITAPVTLKAPADTPIRIRDMNLRSRSPHILLILVLAAAALAVCSVPAARAKTYSDVAKSYWAATYITSVTDRAAAGHRLLDDYGASFKPEQAITRELLARSLVLASGHYGEKITPVAIKDVAPGYRYYSVIELAVKHGYMTLDKDGDFLPTQPVSAAKAETAMVRWLRERYASSNWTLLTSLLPSRWEPNPGWRTAAPSYLPAIVASRQLELRYNHSTDGDGHEVTPNEPIDRGEIAYMFYRAFQVSGEWQLYGLADYKDVTFPVLSDRQKQVVDFSLKFIGYPYIWAGEYPTKDSPYGYQKAGGFDCSGFVFYIMKMHFGYPITVNERGAHDMAALAKPRITRKQLLCGDLIFFGPKGPDSSVNSIYHAALYLGNGWFIQSTGSSDGVTISSLDTSTYWKAAFAWGRRLLTPAELVVPAASAAPAALAPSPAPTTP